MPSESRYAINPLVAVAIPSLEPRPISWQWVDAIGSIDFPLACSSTRIRCFGMEVDAARNRLVEQALEANADYIFFLSDDVLPPPTAFKLLHRHREALVTGVYWTKGYPTQPYIFKGLLEGPYVDWKYGEYFPIDWAGCDCLLVHMDVFRKIEPPWFNCNWKYAEGGEVYHPTEDAYFYTKVREAGFQLYCDTEVQCGHQDRKSGIVYGLTPDMTRYFGGELIQGDKQTTLVADLGSGTETPWFGSQSKVVRYDGSTAFNPDYRCDLRAIPAPTNTYDIVHARHVLEHFAPFELVNVVKEWKRILKPGGRIILNVPNIAYAARQILRAEEGEDVSIYPLHQLYGEQHGFPNEVHKMGFNLRSMRSLLESSGFQNVEVTHQGLDDINVNGVGVKPLDDDNNAPKILQPSWFEAEARDAAAAQQAMHDGKDVDVEVEEVFDLTPAGKELLAVPPLSKPKRKRIRS